MARILYYDVRVGGNPVNAMNIEVTEGHKQASARCSFEVTDITGIVVNQSITVDLGYNSAHGQIFVGSVDTITEARMPGTYTIEGRDVLKRAMEHFLVTTNIDHPWSRSNISAEGLVRDLLREAGITSYSGAATGFTFGTTHPAEFNLMSSWDAISQICNILAYNCYAENGVVYFQRVTPEPGPVASKTITVGNVGTLTHIEYTYDVSNLRNRVVVFGRSPIYAERHVASPYLPAGFYKTAIVSSELINTQSMADQSAQYNLNLYNRLTESMGVEFEGDHTVRCRDTVEVTEPFTEMAAERWFVFSATHRLHEGGYTTQLNLTK